MTNWKGKKYTNIIGYGVGGYYEKTKKTLSEFLTLNYLCDRKWEDSDQKEYDGIPIIRIKNLGQMKEALVVVFATSPWMYESIQSDLNVLGMEYVHVNEVIGAEGGQSWNGKMLKEQFPDGYFEDVHGNKIYFDGTLPDKLTILFKGSGNVVKIGKNITVGSLFITFGSNGFCSIGENTEIIGAEFYIADAGIRIGCNCLFSTQVILRTHDGHHIFDRKTCQRVNASKSIEIKDYVWVGFRAMLLGGAQIGTGSVVGANAVSSKCFGEHVIIAGVPAKVIRENICWSKDDTELFNWSRMEECVSSDAWKY